MLNLPFQIFYLAIPYLTEEENSSQCLKILTQITIEDENELAEIRGVFPPKNYEQILPQWPQTYHEKLLYLLQRFLFYKDQRRKDGDVFETDTVSSFQNTPELKRAKTYSALSFDRITFINMANLFSLSRKAFVMCYCFREPIKTFFFDACQKTVKLRVLHFFPVLQTGRRHMYNKHLIGLVFSVRTVNYGSSFFSIDLWPKREAHVHGP